MPPEGKRMVRTTFIMEQHLGHQVHYQNLRQLIDDNEKIIPTWVPVTYIGVKGFWDRFPFLTDGMRGSLTGRRQVQQGLKANPYDVIYFNTQVPAALQSPRANGRPYIIATDITPIQQDQLSDAYRHSVDSNALLRRYKQHVNSQVFKGAARLLPWSSWTAKSLVADYGLDPARVEVMPVGIDLESWPAASHTPHIPVRILFVGGDFVRKGGPLLLQAFQSLPAGCAELILVTRSQVPSQESVIVYGKVQPNSSELKILYQTSDIFVLPSVAEAFGIAAIEACASGLPVIATSVGGLSDIVADQETGFLIPVGDVRALASALRILVENAGLRREMGLAAYRLAQSRFDIRKNAARVVEILVETALQERQ
jgi:glycosyltransferase involved in cell wall biosynthesis